MEWVAVEGNPFSVLVDRHAFGEVLALADPDVKQTVDDQTVDLGDPTVDLDPEVADRHLVLVRPEVELDLVGGVTLAARAGPDHPDLLFDPAPSLGVDIRTSEECFERVDLRLLVVRRLDQHR